MKLNQVSHESLTQDQTYLRLNQVSYQSLTQENANLELNQDCISIINALFYLELNKDSTLNANKSVS